MNQPKIDIKRDFSDQIFDWIALVLLMLTIILPIYFFQDMSETIPAHYGTHGKADGYGGKSLIWILVGASIFIYVLFKVLSKSPHQFNYPIKITTENAEFQYKIALKMMRYLKVFILLSFLYLIWISIQNGLGNKMNLGVWFTPVFLIVLFAIILWPMYITKMKKQS